ncbi:MAG: LexA family transcriptional regulator [Bacteroides sp.]|nr:LexA family transcriptional regulator [Bacteroides sp.]
MNYFHIQIVNLCFMPVNQEFKRLIDKIKYEYSINQSQIADKLGVKKTYISDMINGRVPYNETMSKKISDVFQIQTNEQSSYINKQEKTIEISNSDIKEGVFNGTMVYDIDATCGTNNRDIEFAEDRIIGSVDLPEISKTAKIVTANGDSMEPVICNGNRVVIRQIFDWEEIFYGQIYLILLDEYRMIKYIRRYEQDEENYIILRSENPKYDDIKLHKSKIRKLFIIENILSVRTQI